MTLEEALSWTRILLSWSVLLQGAEMLLLRPAWSDRGVWSWQNLKSDERGFSFLKILLGERGFSILLRAQILAALISLLVPSAGLLLVMWIAAFFTSLRWRGSFNGGSDSMTLHSLGAVLVVYSFPGYPKVVTAALAYMVVQLSLSYVIAGLVKIKHRGWRSGLVLGEFFENSNYLTPQINKTLLKNNIVSRTLAWGILFFECSFFLIFFDQRIALFYLGLGFLFHLVNFYLLGLNRFFWSWIATYPILFYFCQ